MLIRSVLSVIKLHVTNYRSFDRSNRPWAYESRCTKCCCLFLKDSKITLDQYRALGFPGALEIGNMFEFYVRGNPDRDVKATRKLNRETQRFDVWVGENKAMLEQAFDALEVQPSS